MYNKQWFQGTYTFDFIVQRYKENTQTLNKVFKDKYGLDHLPDKLSEEMFKFRWRCLLIWSGSRCYFDIDSENY